MRAEKGSRNGTDTEKLVWASSEPWWAGLQRFATADASRNNLFVALLLMGEGWHNYHHHCQSSANQGFRWWEIDVSNYLIRLLTCLRLVWDVREPPRGAKS